MRTPFETAQDMRRMASSNFGADAHGWPYDRTRYSLEEGAQTIEQLLAKIAALEAGLEVHAAFAERHCRSKGLAP